jgi:hypothetical protein
MNHRDILEFYDRKIVCGAERFVVGVGGGGEGNE